MSTLSIKIGAVLDSSFNSTMTGSTTQLSRLGDTIRQLDSSMKSVSKFKQLSHDTLIAKKSWKDLEGQVKSLSIQMKTIEKPSRALKAEFNQVKASVTKAKTAYLHKRDALHSLNKEVRKSGKDIKSLVRDQYKLGSSLETLKGKYSTLGSVIRRHKGILAERAHLRSQIMETIGLGLTLAAPIKVAIDFESAMADVKKVVNFDTNTTELVRFAEELKTLSREIPLSAGELAQIAASGGQLGIAKEKLLSFTGIVAKMATAFDISAEKAGDSIAKLSNIYGIEVEGMERVGNIINHLSDNTAAKAKDMVEALAIVGGTAKQFGLDIKQISSLVNSFISLGKQPAKAATAINALLTKLQTAEGQGKEFKAALEEIGITAEEMTEQISQNGQEALLYFLGTLEKIDKQERSTILLNLFGQEYQDDIALLVGSLKKYKEAISHLSDEEKYNRSMQKEFNNRAETTANNLQLLKNTIAEVGMNLGSVMLPTLNVISKSLRYITTQIALFAETYPTITAGIMGITSLFIVGKIALVGFGYALALVKGGALTLSAILYGTLGSALAALSAYMIPAVVTGFKVLTAAMVNNPIGAVIVGLSAGAALVIANWQKVKDFFTTMWNYIRSIIKPIGEAFEWMGSSVFGKVFENSPLKEFEKKKDAVSLLDGKVVNNLSKNSIFNDGSHLLNNSMHGEVFRNSKNNNVEYEQTKSEYKK